MRTQYHLNALFLVAARRHNGRLNANDGVLRAADGSTLSVPVTGPLTGTTLQGDGWSVTLNAGWVVQPAARPGSFVLVSAK